MGSNRTDNENSNRIRIRLIDNLLSTKWVSHLDMCIELDNAPGLTSVNRRANQSKLEYYSDLMANVEGSQRGRLDDVIRQIIDIWALVRKGINIVRIPNKDIRITSNRDILREQLIESMEFDPQCDDKELDEYGVSDAFREYLRNSSQSISVYRYKERNYSIFKLREGQEKSDWMLYNEGLEMAMIQRKIDSNIHYDSSDAEKYGIVPDPDVIYRKRQDKMIASLQDNLLSSTTKAVNKRLKRIKQLKKDKPDGWEDELKELYLQTYFDGESIGMKPDHCRQYYFNLKNNLQNKPFSSEISSPDEQIIKVLWIVPPELIEIAAKNVKGLYYADGYNCTPTVTSLRAENNLEYSIVIDCLPDAISISISPQILKVWKSYQLRSCIRTIKNTLERIGILEQFIDEIRDLYIYAINKYPKDAISYKYKYATIGNYAYTMDRRSIQYLKECASFYEKSCNYDENAAISFYCLAINEKNEECRTNLLRKAVSHFELCSLGQCCNYYYIPIRSLCLIELADCLNNQIDKVNNSWEECYQGDFCEEAYAKVMDIMKIYISNAISELGLFNPDFLHESVDYIVNLVNGVETRLRQSKFASDYTGILPRFFEECLREIRP